jgi:hypothetical protein
MERQPNASNLIWAAFFAFSIPNIQASGKYLVQENVV